MFGRVPSIFSIELPFRVDGVMERMIRRRLVPRVASLMQEELVVALQGPRTVGKTTLLRQIAHDHGVEVIDLDDPATRDAARADPSLFVGGPRPVCVDEYQHVPEILDAIKAELNVDGRPGRFLMTGSTRHDALPLAAQALTGRLHVIEVLPLSQGELAGTSEVAVETLLHDPARLVTASTAGTSREDYVHRVCAGGFPLAQQRTGPSQRRWFDDYVRLTVERDVAGLAKLRQREKLPLLLARLAGQTAQVLNIRRAAQDVDLANSTAAEYVTLLEAVFLLQLLPAWGTTLSSRATKSPKVHVVDSGVGARLLRLSPEKLAERDASSLQQFGHLLESFVVGEVRKQLSWSEVSCTVGHWRTSDDEEVDIVIETDEGAVVGIEVKAGSRVQARDLSGLRRLRDKLGRRFVGGVALYTGGRAFTIEDRLHVLPVDRLWS